MTRADRSRRDMPDRMNADLGAGMSSGRTWLLAAACAALVYVPTMAPGVLWGDSGDAQLRVLAGKLTDARELARSHVTYYATAIALHRAFRLEPALAANLVSALAGVLTVANFACLVSLFVRRRWSVACATGLLLFSHTLWQLSTGAEVVTFSTMCLSFELVSLVQFARTGRVRWLAAAGLANGIGWSTHNFAMLTWPAYAVIAVIRWKALPPPRWRALALAGAGWVVGCAPLFVLIGLEYQRLGSAGDAIRSLLVGGYARHVFNLTITAKSLASLAGFVILSFPTPLILLFPYGWWRLRHESGRGTWLFLSVAGLVLFLFAARYDVSDQYTFFVHAYLLLILFVGVGIDRWLDRHSSRGMMVVVLLLSLTGPPLYALAPSVTRRCTAASSFLPKRKIPYRDPYVWFLTPWRTGYDGPERYAREVFDNLPPDAVLLVDSTMRCPLDYFQGRYDCRLDVRLPHGPYRWERQRPIPRVGPDNAHSFVSQRLLFCASNVRSYVPAWLLDGGYRLEPMGCVFRVEPAGPVD